MRRNSKGFTLVELLVVMAIIAILASIVVPNVIKYLAKSRATRARADIAGIESALVKVLADSGRSRLDQLFNPTAVNAAIGIQPGDVLTTQAFLAAQNLYSRALYAILRDGRGAVAASEFTGLFNENVVRRLGTSYMDVGFDPWQNLFNIYPGPWPTGNGPIPFRKYFPESSVSATGASLPGRGDSADALTLGDSPEEQQVYIDPESNQNITIGFPAARDKVAFIWSNGENLVSGQAIYNPSGWETHTQYNDNGADDTQYYDLQSNQEYQLLGGGDDVNNWDNGSSWTPFY